MMDESMYYRFIKEKGRPMSELNPGSDEVALTVDNALQVLELIKDSGVIISGGDIVSENNGELIYAYQLWGEEYHCLNWYCDRMDNESTGDYLKRSHKTAREAIFVANTTAERFNAKCFIVLIT